MDERRARIRALVVALALMVGVGVAALQLLTSQDGSTTEIALVEDGVVPVVDVAAAYDPVKAGDPLPDGFRQLLGRDQIEPVYNPVFTAADHVDWPLDSLIIGVAGPDTAKAYPVTHLNQHEMVIDHLEGMPILVSW